MSEKRRSELLDYFVERFGVPLKAFQTLDFLESDKGKVFACTRAAAQATRWVERVAFTGLPFARASNGFKPSTAALQLVGGMASCNVLELGEAAAKKFAAGEDLASGEFDASRVTPGFVAVSFKGLVLGCGLLKNNGLHSNVPKAKRSLVSFS